VPDVAFDPVRHEYTVDGRVVRHVTGVLRSALGDPFARVPMHVLERKRQIGQAAHRAIELDDAGDLDELSVHPEVTPYLEAWRDFRRQFPFVVILSEQWLYSPVLDLATTPDRVVTLRDPDGDASDAAAVAVVEFKSGLPGPLAGLQTAAQALVFEHCSGITPRRRFAMQAKPDGKYRLTEYTSPGDFRDFLSCLNIVRLKERLAA
jgi:hypothetical protein